MRMVIKLSIVANKNDPRNKGKFLIQNDKNEDSYLQIISQK